MAKTTAASEPQGQSEIITRLAVMNLPVGSPEEMEEEIVRGRQGIKKKRNDPAGFAAES